MKTLPTTTIAIPADQINERIVAEVCASWQNGHLVGNKDQRHLVSYHFEKAIAFNQSRGYELDSWQLGTVLDDTADPPTIIETIVAVFKRNHSHRPASQ